MSIVNACIIWISKLAPIAVWNTEQALYNLRRQEINPLFIVEHTEGQTLITEVQPYTPTNTHYVLLYKTCIRVLNIMPILRSQSLFFTLPLVAYWCRAGWS